MSSIEYKLLTMQTTRQALTSQYCHVLANDVTYVDALASAYRVAQNMTYMYISLKVNPTMKHVKLNPD